MIGIAGPQPGCCSRSGNRGTGGAQRMPQQGKPLRRVHRPGQRYGKHEWRTAAHRVCRGFHECGGLGPASFTFTDQKVFSSPAGTLGATNGNNNILPALAVDHFGNVYAVWSENQNVFLSSSSDQGKTWTAPGPSTYKRSAVTFFPVAGYDSRER